MAAFLEPENVDTHVSALRQQENLRIHCGSFSGMRNLDILFGSFSGPGQSWYPLRHLFSEGNALTSIMSLKFPESISWVCVDAHCGHPPNNDDAQRRRPLDNSHKQRIHLPNYPRTQRSRPPNGSHTLVNDLLRWKKHFLIDTRRNFGRRWGLLERLVD